jgi:V/A-type H+-transporting ATPase subunit E
MQEIDNVSRKILDDAEEAKEHELERARKEARDIIEKAKQKAAEIHREGKLKAWEKHKEILNIELSRVKSELDQKILMYKLNLIDDVIGEAKKRLLNMDREDYKKFIAKNLKALNIDSGYYIIGSEENNIDSSMIESAGNFKRSEENPDFKRGVKIIKGRTEYNISPDTLIDSNIDDIRMEVASYLFSDNGGGGGDKE